MPAHAVAQKLRPKRIDQLVFLKILCHFGELKKKRKLWFFLYIYLFLPKVNLFFVSARNIGPDEISFRVKTMGPTTGGFVYLSDHYSGVRGVHAD